MKLWKKFKSIMPHVTVLTAEDIRRIFDYSKSGNVELIDKTLSQKKFRVIPLPVNDIYIQAFMCGKLDVIHYLLTSAHSKEFHGVNLNEQFSYGCRSADRNFIYDILNSQKIKKNITIKNIEDLALSTALSRRNIDVIDFLISSPQFKNKLDLHINNDILFKVIFAHGTQKMLEHLIFDLKIEMTEDIKITLIRSHGNPKLSRKSDICTKMFEVRDLKQELETINNFEKPKKRVKI